MGAVPFDTLKMSEKLEASGMDRVMARRVVDVVVEGLRDAKVSAMADRPGVKSNGVHWRVEPAAPSRAMIATGGGYVVRGNDTARLNRNFLLQLAFMVAMWVWAMLLGMSFILPHR